MGLVLAIVGSTKFASDLESQVWAARKIAKAIKRLHPHKIISGGAIGIDHLAAAYAKTIGLELEEFHPKYPRWEPEGYKERNMLIVQNCDHLLCIRHYRSLTYGAGWTADRAEEMGKPVERLMYVESAGYRP